MSTKGRIIGGLVAAGVLLTTGMFLLGLPGMAVVGAADSLLGPSGITTFKGDKAWPAAIYVTNAMPIGIILSAIVLALVRPDAGIGSSTLWGALGYIVVGVIVTILLILAD